MPEAGKAAADFTTADGAPTPPQGYDNHPPGTF
jgi:hypothetical protein